MPSSFTPVSKEDPGIRADEFNAGLAIWERLSRITASGATISDGASGLKINVPESDLGLLIGKASVTSGSYPSFDNDRKVFPVQLYIGPYYDQSLPLAGFDFSTTQVPEVQVYNLAECWIFENSFLPIFRNNGQLWTWNNQKRTGVAAANIAKGATGNVTVQSLSMTARAKFGDTVNGKKISVYHDGTEWVIDAEEC